MNTAEKKDEHTPMIKVIANPFTKPVPRTTKMIAVINVVMLASKIVQNALL